MKKIIILFMLGATYDASAQAFGNANEAHTEHEQRAKANLPIILSDNQVVLQAEVLYNAKPQSYLAIFAVNEEDSTIDATNQKMTRRLEAFKTNLLNMGIASAQIFTDFVSLLPKYELQSDNKKAILRPKQYQEVPIGFQLKKNIHVSFTEGKLMDRVSVAAAQVGIYDLAKVEVNSTDLKRIYEELRTEAMKIIQNKASLYAPLGIKMLPLSVGEAFKTYYPAENYEDYTAFVTDYSNAQTSKPNKTHIRYANKDKSIFYNRIAYDSFDQVIHPDFTEPPIQIHFKLQVKYQTQNLELAQKIEADKLKAIEREDAARRATFEVQKAQAEHPPQVCCPKN